MRESSRMGFSGTTGIVTPLSEEYEKEILRRTSTRDLAEALRKIQGLS
jgi:hypothetical protein